MKRISIPVGALSVRDKLFWTMCGLLVLHALAVLFLHDAVVVSRTGTALMPILVAACCIWRSTQLAPRERFAWWWVSAALLLWASGQLVEIRIGASPAASSLKVDPSDLLYLTAAFPLLLAFSSTSETQPMRGILFLNLFQALLAAGLTWVRLFRTPMAPGVADTILLRIYAADCILLVIAATVRMVSWATQEERRRMRMVCTVLWLYLPVELGMDYATARWHLRQGTLLDLLWSVPFFYGGWRFLQMPMDEPEALTGRRARGEAAHGSVLLLQSLCPMLITLGVFGLAVSIAGQHAVLAMVSILLLLIVQGLLSGVIQVNYLQQRALLVKREQELEAANSGLERLSLVDPLTGIANRRQFTEAFEAEWKRSARRQENIAILMIDVDYFKSVNDLHGHAYGDECLVRIAQCLRGALKRGADLAARYGGEEFVIVLPETGLTGAIEVAERVQDRVGAQRMENEASPFGGEVTISIGIAAVLAEPEFAGAHARAALIDQADRALYLAKREGRNRIEIYDSSSVGFVPSAVVTERGQGTS